MNYQMLRYGSQGSAVKTLQESLNKAPNSLNPLVSDGIFGRKTHSRVSKFQTDNKLTSDGIVGPQTFTALERFLKALPGLVDKLVPVPPGVAAAQARICSAAIMMHASYGWQKPLPYKPEPLNPRIAARWCADSNSRLRQGGVILAQIFAIAGGSLTGVATISRDAERRYIEAKQHSDYFPNWRNDKDIVSWCGLFVLYIYKMSGLKMESWPLRYPQPAKGEKFDPKQHDLRPLSVTEKPQPGDMAILHTAENHHLVITDIQGSQLTTIEGNSDWRFQTIVRKTTRTIQSVQRAPGSFLRPEWSKVLKSVH